jgi:hypothetical protein
MQTSAGKDSAQLSIGSTYFLLGYYDSELKYPFIESFVYVGQNLFDDDKNTQSIAYYFQDARSYLEHGTDVRSNNADVRFLRQEQNDLEGILSINQLVSELKGLCWRVSRVGKK